MRVCRRTQLGEHLITPTTIDPDGRGGNQHWRALRKLGEPLTDQSRPLHSAFSDARLAGTGPTGPYVLTRQVNHSIQSLEVERLEAVLGGVPGDLARPSRSPDHAANLVTSAGQLLNQGGADQTAGAAYRNSCHLR
jgi:hypothetical protein